MGVWAILLGVGPLERGRLHYTTWYGQPMFAPFAILIGLLMLTMAILGRRIGGRRSLSNHAVRSRSSRHSTGAVKHGNLERVQEVQSGAHVRR